MASSWRRLSEGRRPPASAYSVRMHSPAIAGVIDLMASRERVPPA